MRFRIRASWEEYDVESIVDDPVEWREWLRRFQATPGLIELHVEPCQDGEPSGTWVDVPIPIGAGR